jgi:hypothetical protein
MEGRIERPVLDLQYFFGSALDVLSDLVSMGWLKQERSEYEHV